MCDRPDWRIWAAHWASSAEIDGLVAGVIVDFAKRLMPNSRHEPDGQDDYYLSYKAIQSAVAGLMRSLALADAWRKVNYGVLWGVLNALPPDTWRATFGRCLRDAIQPDRLARAIATRDERMTFHIHVRGGCVVEVDNLPYELHYVIHDHDTDVDEEGENHE
jgi:hypothetical protein